jgi:predicted deacylase
MSGNNFNLDSIKKGTKKFGYINIVDNVSAKFDMPVGVINGNLDGPTLAVTGGLYPTEYCGVESAARLYQLINPEELSGRFITIPVMNMSAFQFRTPMFNLVSSSTTPLDRGRINSSFPGNPDGRPTEVLANKVFNILSKVDYHVDFRGGDLPMSHLVHTIYLRSGGEIDKTSEIMAQAFGFDLVLPGTPEIGHTSPGTMIYELVKAGVASIISESGLGYRQQPFEEFIQRHIDGTVNLMKHFGMLDGELDKPEKQNYLDMEWQRARAPVSGIFQAIADQGDICKAGDILGLIKDVDGSELSRVLSPVDGVVHCMYPRRVVHVGDPLYTLLKINEPTGWV